MGLGWGRTVLFLSGNKTYNKRIKISAEICSSYCPDPDYNGLVCVLLFCFLSVVYICHVYNKSLPCFFSNHKL